MLREGKNVLLEIEVNGTLSVLKKCPDALSIFIVPPSLEALEQRIRSRRTEPEEIVQQRLNKARIELPMKDNYRFVVVNDDVERAAAEIAKIIREN